MSTQPSDLPPSTPHHNTPDGPQGDARTREFYDRKGWTTQEGGVAVDYALFGSSQSGQLVKGLWHMRTQRVRDIIRSVQGSVDGKPRILEAGCGGNPEGTLLEMAGHYTGVDFSQTGLDLAKTKVVDKGVPCEFRQADICNLPFADGTFDVVYSAHVFYHMSDPNAQDKAIKEVARVTRPGGVVILILANPRPLAFPGRMLKRVIADTPVVSTLANKIRKPPPLPYQPMTIGWHMARLRALGRASVECYQIPSTSFNQKVREDAGLGKLLWKAVDRCERRHPGLATRLGNYVLYTLRP